MSLIAWKLTELEPYKVAHVYAKCIKYLSVKCCSRETTFLDLLPTLAQLFMVRMSSNFQGTSGTLVAQFWTRTNFLRLQIIILLPKQLKFFTASNENKGLQALKQGKMMEYQKIPSSASWGEYWDFPFQISARLVHKWVVQLGQTDALLFCMAGLISQLLDELERPARAQTISFFK